MRRNVPHDEPEREFTRQGLDVNWFDEGKDTLTRRVKQIPRASTGPRSRPRGSATWSPTSSSRRRVPRRHAFGIAVKCRFLIYRNRVETETDLLVGKREDCSGASTEAGRSPGAGSSSTRSPPRQEPDVFL